MLMQRNGQIVMLLAVEGLLALLLIVLEWTRPGLPTPLRPICDLRVLDHFIKEAQDAEVAMKSCREGCSLSDSVTVPQTTVDFDVWEKKNTSTLALSSFCGKALEQAREVQSGLWLLQQALSLLRTSVTNTALHSHIDNSIRNLLSINAVLRSLNIQEYTPPASTAGLEGTWRVSSATDLLQVHAKLICVSKGKRRDLTLLTCTLAGGSGVERKIQPSSHKRRQLKGEDSPS
ncbi:erythropoietin isoform X3 [Lates japonicus]|uniref:Erythropoietin n=1 Tax=Lates japonicus TaxID=270547 RepID=A0AAD3MF72_LATJO|nr:erythropoietin isoform X3 [Lates japonicus]